MPHALADPLRCPLINMDSGDDLTIRTLAETIAGVASYTGIFVQDTSKPNGTMRKVMDISKIQKLVWSPTTSLTEGIQRAYENYLCR